MDFILSTDKGVIINNINRDINISTIISTCVYKMSVSENTNSSLDSPDLLMEKTALLSFSGRI